METFDNEDLGNNITNSVDKVEFSTQHCSLFSDLIDITTIWRHMLVHVINPLKSKFKLKRK